MIGIGMPWLRFEDVTIQALRLLQIACLMRFNGPHQGFVNRQVDRGSSIRGTASLARENACLYC